MMSYADAIIQRHKENCCNEKVMIAESVLYNHSLWQVIFQFLYLKPEPHVSLII